MFRLFPVLLLFCVLLPDRLTAGGDEAAIPDRIYVLHESDPVYCRYRREIAHSRRYRGRYVAQFAFPPLTYAEYQLKRGDTLQTVAVRLGISVDAIASASGLVFVHAAAAGDRVLVPSFDGISYTSSAGCSLGWLAAKYDVSVGEIRRFNRFSGNGLVPGGRIFIPGGAMSPLEQGMFYGTAFSSPLQAGWISSGFGMRNDPLSGRQMFHGGVDLGAAHGTPVQAAHEGIVEFAGWAGGYGQLVVIRHAFGYRTLYGHLSHIQVRKGQQLAVRQGIGRVGSTGYSTGPHLHFELHHYGNQVNPGRYALLEHHDRPAAVPVFR